MTVELNVFGEYRDMYTVEQKTHEYFNMFFLSRHYELAERLSRHHDAVYIMWGLDEVEHIMHGSNATHCLARLVHGLQQVTFKG